MTRVAYIQKQPKNEITDKEMDEHSHKCIAVLDAFASLVRYQNETDWNEANPISQYKTKNGQLVVDGAPCYQKADINKGITTAGYKGERNLNGDLYRALVLAKLNWEMSNREFTTLDALMGGIEMSRIYTSRV